MNVSGELIKTPIEQKAVEDAVKTHEGVISRFVNEVIVTAIGDPEFNKRVGDAVIAKVLPSGLTR